MSRTIIDVISNVTELIVWLATTSYALRGRAKALIAASSILDARSSGCVNKNDAYALLDALVHCGVPYPYLLCRELWDHFGLIETAFAQLYRAKYAPELVADSLAPDEALEEAIKEGLCYDLGWKRPGSNRRLPDGTWYEDAVYLKVYDMAVAWSDKDALVYRALTATDADSVPEELRDLYEKSAPYDADMDALLELVVTDDDLIAINDEELEDLFGF